MKEKYELAKKQGLNWQALLIEDTETEIKLLIKEEMLKQSGFKKINDKVVKLISSAIDELESKELKEVAERSLLDYATRVYYYLERTFKSLNLARIWALNAVLRGQQTIQQTRIVNKMMAEEVNKGYARAVPLGIYAKDYMKQVKDRLEYLSKVVAKDDYSERVSLRNIAEMQVRAEEKEKKLKNLVDKGVNLVWIVPHANCSKRCEPWQGKLYSLDGTYGSIDGIKYQPLKNAMDVYETTKSGKIYKNGCISGFNCRHQLEPYKDGNEPTEIPAKVIDREREINDKQRYLERGVRDWKEKAVLLKGIDNESYAFARKKAREWNSKYIQYSKANNVAYYPSRVDILK